MMNKRESMKKKLACLIVGFITLWTVFCGNRDKSDMSAMNDALFTFFPDNRFGVINSRGDIIVQPQYDFISDFYEGLAGVKIGDKCGFIGRDGEFIIKPRFQHVDGGFSEGLACVMENYKYGFIDRNGQWKIRPQFDNANTFSEGIAQVELNGKVGFIDTDGQIVIKLEFHRVGRFSEGLAPAQTISMGKWGYIDKKGNMVIPTMYDYADSFSQGLAAVEKNKKYGYIDKTGKIVLDFKYDYAEDFSEGLASVSINKKYGYINHAGEMVIPLSFDSGSKFSEGLAIVGVGSLYGFINTEGIMVGKPRNFKMVFPFKNGLALAALGVSRNGVIAGYIDRNGKIIKQWSFDADKLIQSNIQPSDPNASHQPVIPADSPPALEVGEGTGIEPPRIIKRVSPEYPKEAVDNNIQGLVLLKVEIDIYGRVIEVSALEGPELLRAAAEKAVKQWIFEPTIFDGVPQRVKMTMSLNFNSDQ